MKTTTTWKKKHEFESKLEDNLIHLDGNIENGFGPKALMLSALAACSGIDVVDILEKMRVAFSDFKIDVEADQTQDHPRVFSSVHILYEIRSLPENLEKIRKAIDLSLDKYCGVAAMLKKNSPITYELHVRE